MAFFVIPNDAQDFYKDISNTNASKDPDIKQDAYDECGTFLL